MIYIFFSIHLVKIVILILQTNIYTTSIIFIYIDVYYYYSGLVPFIKYSEPSCLVILENASAILDICVLLFNYLQFDGWLQDIYSSFLFAKCTLLIWLKMFESFRVGLLGDPFEVVLISKWVTLQAVFRNKL